MVAYDAVGPAGGAGYYFTASPGIWTHVNNGNGIFVGISLQYGSTNPVTAVTYGGLTLPQIGTYVLSGGGGTGGIVLYGKVGPTVPTGSNSVSVAVTDPVNDHCAGSVSVSSAGTLGTPVTAASAGSASSVSATVNGTTPGGLIVSTCCQGAGIAISATSPNILRWCMLAGGSSASDNCAGGTDPSAGGNQTVTYTCATSDNWGIIAVEVLPPVVIPDLVMAPHIPA